MTNTTLFLYYYVTKFDLDVFREIVQYSRVSGKVRFPDSIQNTSAVFHQRFTEVIVLVAWFN